MAGLVDDIRRMSDAAVTAAREIGDVPVPDHLAGLHARLRDTYATELAAVHAELDRRFGRTAADCLGTFKAAADLALLERACHDDLVVSDRWKLRRFWEALVAAR